MRRDLSPPQIQHGTLQLTNPNLLFAATPTRDLPRRSRYAQLGSAHAGQALLCVLAWGLCCAVYQR